MTSQLPRINSMLKELAESKRLKRQFVTSYNMTRLGKTRSYTLNLWLVENGVRVPDQYVYLHTNRESEIVEKLKKVLEDNRL